MKEIRPGYKIQVNSEELQNLKDVPHALIEFDQNAKRLEKMVNSHNQAENINQERQINQEIRRQAAIESRKKVKKELTKKNIKKALYVAAGVAIATAAYHGNENIQGKNEIVKEFSTATSDFGVVSYSNGYQINEGDNLVDFETGVEDMISVARKNGMTDSEIAIGLTSTINKETAIDALGKDNYPDYSKRCELYQNAYHQKQANNLESNIEKGNGK